MCWKQKGVRWSENCHNASSCPYTNPSSSKRKPISAPSVVDRGKHGQACKHSRPKLLSCPRRCQDRGRWNGSNARKGGEEIRSSACCDNVITASQAHLRCLWERGNCVKWEQEWVCAFKAHMANGLRLKYLTCNSVTCVDVRMVQRFKPFERLGTWVALGGQDVYNRVVEIPWTTRNLGESMVPRHWPSDCGRTQCIHSPFSQPS